MKKNIYKKFLASFIALTLLSGCGTQRTDRTVAGTIVGAGAGAGIAAATGAIWVGPVILTAVGATAGGIMGRHIPAESLYLGPAPWEFLLYEKRLEKGMDGKPREVIRKIPSEQRLERLSPL